MQENEIKYTGGGEAVPDVKFDTFVSGDNDIDATCAMIWFVETYAIGFPKQI